MKDVFLILATFFAGPLPIKRLIERGDILQVVWSRKPTREQLDAVIEAWAVVNGRFSVSTHQSEAGFPALYHEFPK